MTSMSSSQDERARKKGKCAAVLDPSTSNHEEVNSTTVTLELLTSIGKISERTEGTPISDPSTSKHEEINTTLNLLVGFGKEGISHLDPSTSSDTEPSAGCEVVPADQCLWGMLPGDILELILMGLPVSARCRFRSVCRKWRNDLTSLPYLTSATLPHMILSKSGDGNAKFFSHSERQWFSLPPKVFTVSPFNVLGLRPSSEKSWEVRRPPPYKSRLTVDNNMFTIPSNVNHPSGPTWELVDVDAGLLCYQRTIEGSHWLCVSNPLTSFCQIIVPPDDFYNQNRSDPLVLKLLVDREKKTFKVFSMVDYPCLTALYDSATSRWHRCNDHPYLCSDRRTPDPVQEYGEKELFVWKKKICVYNTRQHHSRWGGANWVVVFNMQSGKWTWHQANFPREHGSETNCFILSNEEQVILIQFFFKRRPFFSVWKLLDDDLSTSAPLFSKWEKLLTGSSSSIGRGIGSLADYRLGRVCSGQEFVCFMFSSNEIKWDGSRIHKCARYSFAAKKWSVVPCPADWGGPFKIFHWEPSLDIISSSPFDKQS